MDTLGIIEVILKPSPELVALFGSMTVVPARKEAEPPLGSATGPWHKQDAKAACARAAHIRRPAGKGIFAKGFGKADGGVPSIGRAMGKRENYPLQEFVATPLAGAMTGQKDNPTGAGTPMRSSRAIYVALILSK